MVVEIPHCPSLVLCRQVVRDPSREQPFSFLGIVDAFVIPLVPFVLSGAVAVVDLQFGRGPMDLALRIVSVEDDAVSYYASLGVNLGGDLVNPFRVTLPIDRWQIKSAGNYEVQLWANQSKIAFRRVAVSVGATPQTRPPIR